MLFSLLPLIIWCVIGLSLVTLEILIFSKFIFANLGLSALLIAIIIYYFDISLATQLSLYAIFNLIGFYIIYSKLKYFKANKSSNSESEQLELINQEVILLTEIGPNIQASAKWSGTIINVVLESGDMNHYAQNTKLAIKNVNGNLFTVYDIKTSNS